MTKRNEILEQSFEFALNIIEYCEMLEENKKFVIAKQLLKSGTSIGANVRESQNAESNFDFVHKLKIAAKEVEETEYWLLLCKNSVNYPNPDKLLMDIKSIKYLLNSIIVKMKNKLKEL